MKHSAFASYDERNGRMRVSVCNFPAVMINYQPKGVSPMQKSNNKLADISVAFAVEILDLVNI